MIADVPAQNGTAMVAITESEGEYSFSRGLVAPMCLTQCIAVSLAAMLQTDEAGSPRIPTVTENLRRKA